jgi:large subunit ribosomal protein L13
MATYIPAPAQIQSDWFVIDADGQVLGRLASKAAMLLMGKHKPDYTPFLPTGDHVVVVNAAKVKLTGRKEQDKMYRSYSGYPGGLKERTAAKMRATHPERMVEEAILGMLPKNKLGKRMATHLRVYRGPQHPHQAQKPAAIEATNKKRR